MSNVKACFYKLGLNGSAIQLHQISEELGVTKEVAQINGQQHINEVFLKEITTKDDSQHRLTEAAEKRRPTRQQLRQGEMPGFNALFFNNLSERPLRPPTPPLLLAGTPNHGR